MSNEIISRDGYDVVPMASLPPHALAKVEYWPVYRAIADMAENRRPIRIPVGNLAAATIQKKAHVAARRWKLSIQTMSEGGYVWIVVAPRRKPCPAS